MNQNRDSTKLNYLHIWCKFNEFLVRLDAKPKDWEDRASLFGAYLVHIQGVQSATLRSYFSAIKNVLTCDGYEWNDAKVLLHTLVKACRIKNDFLQPRFLITFGLLEMLLFEINRFYSTQPYLQLLYKILFVLAYYRLMRVGELMYSPHAVKATNIHIGTNKNKILIVLYTSKTHGCASMPQKIKISERESTGGNKKNFCPFKLLQNFIAVCGGYDSEEELLFILADRSPVTLTMARALLTKLLKSLNLDHTLYNSIVSDQEEQAICLNLELVLKKYKS